MKKLVITLLISTFLVSGCVEVSKKDVNDIFSTVLYRDNKLSNINMEGYSLYLPQGVRLLDKNDYNLKFQYNKTYYYLYIDVIAHHYKTENSYQENNGHYYSTKFNYLDKSGYIDVVENNKEYFVVVMYNYAKIEAYVPKDDFKRSLVNICSILSSIKYNDVVINKMVGSEGVTFQEERFNIFDSTKEQDNFLKYEEEFGTYRDNIDITIQDDVIDIEEVVD